MTRVAANSFLSVERPFVEVKHHPDHSTRSLFGSLVILLEGVRMAVVAFHPQRAGDERHGRLQLRGWQSFEDLNVFVHLFGSLNLQSRNLLRFGPELYPRWATAPWILLCNTR